MITKEDVRAVAHAGAEACDSGHEHHWKEVRRLLEEIVARENLAFLIRLDRSEQQVRDGRYRPLPEAIADLKARRPPNTDGTTDANAEFRG